MNLQVITILEAAVLLGDGNPRLHSGQLRCTIRTLSGNVFGNWFDESLEYFTYDSFLLCCSLLLTKLLSNYVLSLG